MVVPVLVLVKLLRPLLINHLCTTNSNTLTTTTMHSNNNSIIIIIILVAYHHHLILLNLPLQPLLPVVTILTPEVPNYTHSSNTIYTNNNKPLIDLLLETLILPLLNNTCPLTIIINSSNNNIMQTELHKLPPLLPLIL